MNRSRKFAAFQIALPCLPISDVVRHVDEFFSPNDYTGGWPTRVEFLLQRRRVGHIDIQRPRKQFRAKMTFKDGCIVVDQPAESAHSSLPRLIREPQSSTQTDVDTLVQDTDSSIFAGCAALHRRRIGITDNKAGLLQFRKQHTDGHQRFLANSLFNRRLRIHGIGFLNLRDEDC